MTKIKQLGKYEVLEIAGKGNMAVVYKAHDPFADLDVAIKLCQATEDQSGGKIARKLFFNEAHTAGALDHPNILSVLDAGEQDNQPYIVMEYVEGADTLRTYIQPDALLPIPRVVEILYQCAKALDYAHRRGVIHRDIKPSNIMLTQDGQVKIGDFGIAEDALSDETQVMGMLGSPRYMSPEQVRETELNHQTDLYSLGVVAYELVTGSPPLLAKSIVQMVRKIIDDEPVPIIERRPDAPPKLVDIINKAMAKSIEQRYEYGYEMAADLAMLFGELDHGRTESKPVDRFKTARELAIFNEFSDAEIKEVLKFSHWFNVAANTTVIDEKESEDAFYIIASGAVSIGFKGREVAELYKGQCFGEIAVINRSQRSASVTSREESSLIRISGKMLERISMGCQLRFNQVFLKTMIARLALSNERIVNILDSRPADSASANTDN